jgi:hypothetical protein
MDLTVTRKWFSLNSTCGIMDSAGIFLCYTLEPRMSQAQGKPFAIPAATYGVTLEQSPHFTDLMAKSPKMKAMFADLFPDGRVITPHLQNVPGFKVVEIHPGNEPKDTDACTLVGQTHAEDFVGASDIAFRALMGRLTALGTLVTPADPTQMAYYDLSEEISVQYVDSHP